MLKHLKTLIAGAALALASAASSAAVWTQTIDPVPDLYVGPPVNLNFDLTTVGFNPASDTITGFTFTLRTYDDASDCARIPIIGTVCQHAEWVFADLPGLLADGLWTTTGTYSTGTSLLGAFSLNINGQLSATVSAPVGDFMFDWARLDATGHSVPEPGTLALVGLALAGAGIQRKRAQAKK